MRICATPAALLLALSGLCACGSDRYADPPGGEPEGAVDPLLTTAYPLTVLDDGGGAELCLGSVLESLPPQCGGPRLVGWDWTEHEGRFEEVGGTRWGEFVVTGTYDGATMTPTEVVAATLVGEPEIDEPAGFTTPCPEPDGGWPVHEGATQATVDRTFAAASRFDGYADSWLDSTRDGRSPEQTDEDLAAGVGDVSGWTVNVRVSGDPAAAETELRELWRGALCVTGAEHGARELRRLLREVRALPGLLVSGIGDQRVEITVAHDDGRLQRRLDEEHGPGMVSVESVLRPVAEPGRAG